jgi:hypothetical protein
VLDPPTEAHAADVDAAIVVAVDEHRALKAQAWRRRATP